MKPAVSGDNTDSPPIVSNATYCNVESDQILLTLVLVWNDCDVSTSADLDHPMIMEGGIVHQCEVNNMV